MRLAEFSRARLAADQFLTPFRCLAKPDFFLSITFTARFSIFVSWAQFTLRPVGLVSRHSWVLFVFRNLLLFRDLVSCSAKPPRQVKLERQPWIGIASKATGSSSAVE